MAAVSALPAQKRKKNVYGKLGRSGFSTTNLDSFFDEDELAASKHTVQRQPNVKATYTVRKNDAKTHSLKPVKSRAKKQDTFDVPSSDDDSQSPPKIVSPPKWKPNLVDDTESSSVQLAQWEKRKAASSSVKHTKTTNTTKIAHKSSPDVQPKRDLVTAATTSPESSPSKTSTPKNKSAVAKITSPVRSSVASDELGTAAARLAARKRLADSSVPSSADERLKPVHAVPKRSGLTNDRREGTPRKRARTSNESKESGDDVVMVDAFPDPICAPAHDEMQAAGADQNVYDFPNSDLEEAVSAEAPMPSSKAAAKPRRRGKLTTYARSTPRKGVSAPARLAEMIADDDTTEPSTQPPSETPSRGSTPQQPSTPPPATDGSPEKAFKAAGAMTPKQANLWNRLLPSVPIAPSPSTLQIKDLSISGGRRKTATLPQRKLTKSQSDVGRRRTRLVDRLKAAAPSSDDELSEGHEEEDNAREDVPAVGEKPASPPADPDEAPKLTRQASESQHQSISQSTTTATSGPKITYSRVRSYLPEDNFEDELMLGLAADTPQHTSTIALGRSKSAVASQRSAFDLDESDEEGGVGKMRSIHELRASGSNARGIGDIEELLDDIEKHNVSQKGSRGTALITLATNLMTKSFKYRFVGQSCELRLVAECASASDDIADFVLAAAIALLTSSDPPEHVVRSLHEQDVVTWLSQRLANDVEVSKIAKDRRNNMSKASTKSLNDFADKLKKHSALWDEETPSTISPRIVAMKALDLLVRNLRRLGDRTELLSGAQLQSVLRDPGQALGKEKQLDTALGISVLESLSTTSLPLHWPTSIFSVIAQLFPSLDGSSSLLRHMQFLALRLCLNLTNDNVRNCGLLVGNGTTSTVRYLLQAIKDGFGDLETEGDAERRTVALDLLVLATGIMINLAEHCDNARMQAANEPDLLAELVDVFRRGQERMLDAESVEESISNVTFGYLAVMLANLCQRGPAKAFIAFNLPGQNLGMLIEAVEEFVLHHQKVDMMNFEGEEGKEVWGAFTEKLKGVLARLRE